MTDSNDQTLVPSKIASTPGIQWVAGLVVSTILSLILGLAVVAIDNEWAQLVALSFLGLIIAVAVGFAVRFTSAGQSAFWAAAISGGLGVNTVTSLAGVGFDNFGFGLLYAFQGFPVSAYTVFFGVIAGVVAIVGRRS